MANNFTIFEDTWEIRRLNRRGQGQWVIRLDLRAGCPQQATADPQSFRADRSSLPQLGSFTDEA